MMHALPDEEVLREARTHARARVRLHVDKRVGELVHETTVVDRTTKEQHATTEPFKPSPKKTWRLRRRQRFVLKPLALRQKPDASVSPAQPHRPDQLTSFAFASILFGAAAIAASFVILIYPFHLVDQ